MRKGLLGTIAALAASAGLATAQPPAAPIMPTPGYVAPAGAAALLPAGGPLPYGDGPPAAPGLLNGYFGGGPGGGAAGGLAAERGWFSGDYILWFIRTMPAQPLVTAGTAAAGGAIPDVGSTVLFGAENFNVNPLSGARWEQGVWSRRFPLWGFSWGGFVTEQRTDTFRATGNNQVIARPFIDADTGLPNSFLVSFPGLLSGDITAGVKSQIWGLEYLAHRKLLADETRRLTFQTGFRFLDLHEDLVVNSRSTVLPGNTIEFYNLTFGAGTQVAVNDRFNTRNQYMLGQLGFQADLAYRRWLVTWGTKVGLGGVYQTLDISGDSSVTPPGGTPNTVLGGLLAVDSNIGRYHAGRFAVVPEGKLQVVYRMCGCIDLGMGYTFTYLSRVIRPSEQIDLQVSTTRVPASANYAFPAGEFRPRVAINESDMWIQGLNFTVGVRY